LAVVPLYPDRLQHIHNTAVMSNINVEDRESNETVESYEEGEPF